MKNLLLVTLLVFECVLLSAQLITKEEALQFAGKLEKTKILSAKGTKLLTEQISDNQITGLRPQTNEEQLAVSQLFVFLTYAFESDVFYRSGMLEQLKLVKQLQEKNDGNPLSKEDIKTIEDKLENLDVYKIEDAIKDENSSGVEPSKVPVKGDPVFKEVDLIDHSRSVLGKSVKRTLNDLLSIKLIDDVVFEEANKLVEENKIKSELYLLGYITDRVIYYEDFDDNKAKETAMIEALSSTGLISYKNVKYLSAADQNILRNKYDLIEYCRPAKVIHLDQISPKPAEGFEQIFKEISTLHPQFKFKDFKTTLVEVKAPFETDSKEYNAKISFKLDDTEYTHEFFYDYIKDDAPPATVLKVSSDFQMGVNKYLTAIGSDQRLYYANKADGSNIYGSDEFGLILLTREQYELWDTTNLDYFLFEQKH